MQVYASYYYFRLCYCHCHCHYYHIIIIIVVIDVLSLFIHYLFIYVFVVVLLILSFASFLLPLSVSSSWIRLHFLAGKEDCLVLAGELACLFVRIFPHGGGITCICENCSGGVFVICHCLNQGWESTLRLHLFPLGVVLILLPPGIKHQVEGTLILCLLSSEG